MSGSTSLTILSEDQKFNGDNLLQWKTNITQLLGSKGLIGYINGQIVKPGPETIPLPPDSETPTIQPINTPIYSSKPTLDEWMFRDQLARGHITLNCTDVAALGVTTTGTAKEAWESIQTEWGRSTDMRRSHAQEILNRTEYVEGTDIQEHVKLLRTRRAAVDNLSTSVMTDETWRGIIIRSIPPTQKWLPVIPSLYALSSSADIISTLLAHGMVLGRYTTNKGGSSSNTVLAARTSEACTNPDCKAKKRSTHTSANCYWPGGGKEGQFPPGFGQHRAKANATTSTPTTTTSNTPTTAAISTTTQTNNFVLTVRVPDPGQSGVLIDDPTDYPPMAFISKGFQNFGKEIPTFMDSGASDTMFVSRNVFDEYTPIASRVGDSAKAVGGGFEIVGEGSVVQHYQVNGEERTITYTRALHTPSLNANLISISAFDKAGLTTTFSNGQGIIRKADGTIVLEGRNVNGMYILETIDDKPLAMSSISQPTSLEQWHRRLTHCSPLTIQEMATKNLVDGLKLSGTSVTGKCEDCILGRQTRRPFDGETEKDLEPLDLVSFDLWGPSRVQSAGGKLYLMMIVDAGASHKYGVYLQDKSDTSTIAGFDTFRTTAETLTGRKIRRLRTDRAFESNAWKEYCQTHGIIHEFTAPYSSAQNGLAERAIRTTMDDVRTLLKDSGLSHSFWAEAAAYSIDTRNLIPSRRHPGKIPLEVFTKKRQDVSHLRVFGAKCWAKVPTALGGSKLDPRSVECRLLGYATGRGNYKVQNVTSHRVFVSRDVIFEEGQPHRTSASVGENIPVFETNTEDNPPADKGPDPAIIDAHAHHDSVDPVQSADITAHHNPVNQQNVITAHQNPVNPVISVEQRRSTRTTQPSRVGLQSMEYKARETAGKNEGKEWANVTIDGLVNDHEGVIACLNETKASHNIPRSYRHAMATDPDRWMIPMKVEMETLKSKHTWDLVKPPPGANIMDSMWVYDIKWDGEGNRIKDKARLVGKGYTQQLGIDYNETWAAVTRLESVRITAAVAAKLNLKLWRIDFVGAYLNSLTKEDIYMKQPEGFVETGYEDHVAKLVHTIYGTMQGAHDWYETLSTTFNELGYTTSRADPCVRFKEGRGKYTITDTYTDDIFGASKDEEEIKERKDEIGKIWDIKDVGETEYFLGMRVQQDLKLGTIRLTQRPYWEHVLARFNLENVTPRNTPLPIGIILDSNMSPKTSSEKKGMDDKPYRSILGSVMWGQLATRPDLAFSISLLARFQANPGIEHWKALIHVVGYIRNTLDYGLTYSRDFDISPTAFVDADYGGCKDTRRSTSGYVFTMAGGAVTWSSKRQSTVALSTVEAEYVAMSRCAQQMSWIHSWLDEVKVEYSLPGLIKGDNQGAIALTKNTKDHGKVKHIDIRHHYIRELIYSGTITLEQVPSADNLADLFTKPLSRDHHQRFLTALNIN